MANQACVLLSGGMDSTAALHWAIEKKYQKMLAVLFAYGQPNRDQELTFAGHLCERLGVPRLLIAVADGLPTGRGILNRVEDHDGLDRGTSPAFVPGRNLFFATSAAAHASVVFPNGNFDLVIGCNAQDAKRFPDCQIGALVKLSETLRHGLAREVTIVAPWIDRTKEEILRSLSVPAINDVSRSWSCYRGDASGPCLKCSACVLRAEAFLAAGIKDQCAPSPMTGGDPARRDRLGG